SRTSRTTPPPSPGSTPAPSWPRLSRRPAAPAASTLSTTTATCTRAAPSSAAGRSSSTASPPTFCRPSRPVPPLPSATRPRHPATGQPLDAFPNVIDDFGLTTVPLLANVGPTIDPGVDPGGTLDLPELISGNGLYLVHAFDFTGREPAGWPKLTGGWHTGSP